jgi:hypothetical protein
MIQTHLVDLDELVQTVRDINAREYIAEAIAAYRARAYRSAIMGTWVAVAYDIIAKIRELAVQGDAAAVTFSTTLDTAIALKATNYVQAIKTLQGIENDLLNQAISSFEFITAQEHTDLERLKQDRNQCAHPAFVTDMLLFQPSPELVRTHIAHAIYHLLAHPPTQGKNALARLKSDLMQPSFPTDQKAVNEFMEMRYFNHAKTALLNNFVTVLLKVIIKASEPDLIGHEDAVLRCLVAFAISHSDIFRVRMTEQLPRLTDLSDDNELKRVFRILAVDKRCWSWLSQPTRIRLKSIVQTYQYDAGSVGSMLGALSVDELRPRFVARVMTFTDGDREALLSRHHRPEFVDVAIELYSDVGRFRDSDRIGRAVIKPIAALMSADQVQRLLAAAGSNNQIYRAGSDTSEVLLDLFEKTADLRDATKPAWQGFMTTVLGNSPSPESPTAHPSVRRALEEAGIWPVPPAEGA